MPRRVLLIAVVAVALFVIIITIHLTVTNGWWGSQTASPTPTPGVPEITCLTPSDTETGFEYLCVFNDANIPPSQEAPTLGMTSDCDGPTVTVTFLVTGSYRSSLGHQNIEVIVSGKSPNGTEFQDENFLLDQGGTWNIENSKDHNAWFLPEVIKHGSTLTILLKEEGFYSDWRSSTSIKLC